MFKFIFTCSCKTVKQRHGDYIMRQCGLSLVFQITIGNYTTQIQTYV
jgi:hypothetical protein